MSVPTSWDFFTATTALGAASVHGFIDIDAKLHLDPGGRSDRVRRLAAKSRPFGFSTEFRIELTEDGRDYAALPDEPAFGSWAEGWSVVRGMLEAEGSPLTAMELWKWWPEDFQRPALPTLRRSLWMAHADGLLVREASGHRNDAFRYWLTGVEPQPRRTRRDPFEVVAEAMRAMRGQGGVKGKD